MDTKEKSKTFSLSRWVKSKFTDKSGPDPGVDRSGYVGDTLATADEWPLREEGHHTYTKFNNEGFYN
jgi:hypothetical protein